MDLVKYAAAAILAVAFLDGCAPPSQAPVFAAEREGFRQRVVPFVGRDMEARSPIMLFDQPAANAPHRPATGRFKLDSIGDINELGEVWVHAVFADGTSGYFTANAADLSNLLYTPPPPPKPLVYPSFIDRLPPKEAARRHALPGVDLGMTADQVLASAWGKPLRVKEIKKANSDKTGWYYPDGNALFFSEYGRIYAIEK